MRRFPVNYVTPSLLYQHLAIRHSSLTTHEQELSLAAANKNSKHDGRKPSNRSATSEKSVSGKPTTNPAQKTKGPSVNAALRSHRFKNDIQKYRLRRALWESNTSLVTSLSMPPVDDLMNECNASCEAPEDCTVPAVMNARNQTEEDDELTAQRVESDALSAIDELLSSMQQHGEDNFNDGVENITNTKESNPLPLILSAQARVKRFYLSTREERRLLMAEAQRVQKHRRGDGTQLQADILRRIDQQYQLGEDESPECTTNLLCIPDLGAHGLHPSERYLRPANCPTSYAAESQHQRPTPAPTIRAAAMSQVSKRNKKVEAVSFYQSLMDAAEQEAGACVIPDSAAQTRSCPQMHVVIFQKSGHEDVMENAAELIHEHYYGLDNEGVLKKTAEFSDAATCASERLATNNTCRSKNSTATRSKKKQKKIKM